MALYLATVDTPRRPGDVFAYLSDFSNTREWDPGVLEAELKLKGFLRRADPALGLVFNRVGDQALAGLRRTLGEAHPRCLRTITGRALDGRARTLPDDLSKPYTFLIVAFRREQQQLPRKAKQLAEILHRPALEEPEQPSRVNARTLT